MAITSNPKDRTPRWVKVQGVFVALLMLAVFAMSSGLLGRHGHGDHASTNFAPSSHDQHIDRHR